MPATTLNAADQAARLRAQAAVGDPEQQGYLLWLAREWERIASAERSSPQRPPPPWLASGKSLRKPRAPKAPTS